MLGVNLDTVSDLVNKYYCTDILNTLNEATKNRVAAVQKAARTARQVWEDLAEKGIALADSKVETEHLEDGPVTPDDLIKVKAGFGAIADARSLGYLKRKSKSKNRKPSNQVYQNRRSKSKQLNQSKNKKNSKIMREKIFSMEQERKNLMKQADVLKKKDASIDSLMNKYIPKSSKKTKTPERGNLMNKIKERMFNVEKGKSVEIKESKRGKQLRLQREKGEEIQHEGGEGDENIEEGKEETKGGKSSTKEISPVKDQPQEESKENVQFEFDQEAQEKGDQVLNLDNVPKDLGKELSEDKKGLGEFKSVIYIDESINRAEHEEIANKIMRKSGLDSTFDRGDQEISPQKFETPANDDLDLDPLEAEEFEEQLLKNQQEKQKIEHSDDGQDPDLVDSLDRQAYEKQLLANHENRQKLERTSEKPQNSPASTQPVEAPQTSSHPHPPQVPQIPIESIPKHPQEAPQPPQIPIDPTPAGFQNPPPGPIPPQPQRNPSADLQLLKQKIAQNAIKQGFTSGNENDYVEGEDLAWNRGTKSSQKWIEEKKKDAQVSEEYTEQRSERDHRDERDDRREDYRHRDDRDRERERDRDRDFERRDDRRRDYRDYPRYDREHRDDERYDREHRDEERYRREGRYTDYPRDGYAPYPVYAPPPVYTQPVYQLPPNMIVPNLSPRAIQTPHFQSVDKSEQARSSAVKDEGEKLVYDVGTSPEPIPEEQPLQDQENPGNKENISIIQAETPQKSPDQEMSHSFAVSPSEKSQIPQNPNMITLDPITRAWCDALSYLESEDYQSAYEIILSTGDDIYLLRLVSHTGPVIKYLHPNTASTVIKKLNQIVRLNIFSVFATDWIEESHKTGVFKTFKHRDQNEYLDTLDLFGKDENDQELADKANGLYKEIIEESTQNEDEY